MEVNASLSVLSCIRSSVQFCPLTVSPGWFCDEHFHTQVPATRGCGPHFCDIITGRWGHPYSQGTETPCQTWARTDLPHRDQDLERDLLIKNHSSFLCFYASSCLYLNHTLNTRRVHCVIYKTWHILTLWLLLLKLPSSPTAPYCNYRSYLNITY